MGKGEGSRTVKATGWIRADSPRVTPTARKPLADRSNLPPLRSAATPKRTQQTLAAFLTPQPARKPERIERVEREEWRETPQVVRRPRVQPPMPSSDDRDAAELNRRATSLLQRRYGTIPAAQPSPLLAKRPRSPSPPAKQPSPILREESPLRHEAPPLRQESIHEDPPLQKSVHEESPLRQQESMESLDSDFSPPQWVKDFGPSQIELYQRLAGMSPEEISALREQRMQEELRRAQKRLAKSRETARKTPRLDPPQELMRSPRSNRKVYALETQPAPAPVEEEEDEDETLSMPAPSDDTLPLPWDDEESPQMVPTSVDEERIPILVPSRSTPGSSPSRPPPSPSPAVSMPGDRFGKMLASLPGDRFGKMLASLHAHERKSHPGAQLSLNSFLQKPTRAADADLDWVALSDDEETQPLPWSTDDDDSQRMSLPTLESMDRLTPQTRRFVHDL